MIPVTAACSGALPEPSTPLRQTPRMDIKQLEYFVAVAEHRNFTRVSVAAWN